jgi:putative ABC transport system ATP-binding protein
MSLLELTDVEKAYGGRVALRDVSLEVDAGEVVAIWGQRRSGRSTLMRVAAGVETPDRGTVRFRGQDISSWHSDGRGGGVAYCRKSFAPGEGRFVLDHLMGVQEVFGVSPSEARGRARHALQRVHCEHSVERRPNELDGAETMRVAIARSITLDPSLLVIDEPTIGVELLERDSILSLLRSLADDGVGILMSVTDAPALSGVDRALAISGGELRGRLTPDLAPVVELASALRGVA